MKTHLSLFSGFGGLDIAAEWAGFTTVGQCEWADYPTKVLQKNWPDVPRWRDIRTLNKESFYERTGLPTVSIISGGFPCQPFSMAGKRKGKEDDRYLWPEMLRIIRELKPDCVVGENVPGILRIAGKTVCEDLEREGYSVAVFNYEAAAVGAMHRRSRAFFVAYTVSVRCAHTAEHGTDKIPSCGAKILLNQGERGKTVYQQYNRLAGCFRPAEREGYRHQFKPETEPCVDRMAHGIPSGLDRLAGLGNAVVPQQAYPIFRAVAEEMDRT